jgi:hypothetical protein
VAKVLLLVSVLAVAQQAIAVQLEAVVVALSGVMELVVLAVIADRLDHQVAMVALALEVVEMVVVATIWVVLLECQSF